jgi:hypothetical protein
MLRRGFLKLLGLAPVLPTVTKLVVTDPIPLQENWTSIEVKGTFDQSYFELPTRKLTNLYISPEEMEDIRNWNLRCVEDRLGEIIYGQTEDKSLISWADLNKIPSYELLS